MTDENDLPIPDNLETCLGLAREEQVYDYYNGLLTGEGAREVEAHLLDCFACRRKLTTLDWINTMLKSRLMPAAIESTSERDFEKSFAIEAHAIESVTEGNAAAFYMVLGGLSLLGFLAVGGVKLVQYARQRHIASGRVESKAVG